MKKTLNIFTFLLFMLFCSLIFTSRVNALTRSIYVYPGSEFELPGNYRSCYFTDYYTNKTANFCDRTLINGTCKIGYNDVNVEPDSGKHKTLVCEGTTTLFLFPKIDTFNIYKTNQSFSSCGFVLGQIYDTHSLAYLLNRVLKFMQAAGPILVIVLTFIDGLKAITGNKDLFPKFLKNTGKRILYAVLLFVFPIVLDFVLKLTSVYGVCALGL